MRMRRVPFLDEYAEGGESAVLVGDRVFVLSELATTILAAVGDETVSVDVVAAVLEEAFGAPPDGTDLSAATAAAVQELVAQGLLEITDSDLEPGTVQ
ncbi:MAG TPA: hypothetical protein VLB03_05250 [Nocardioidaceae bacterium]|nr:hypothetical protein [Nocardioidaceae bacterium]